MLRTRNVKRDAAGIGECAVVIDDGHRRKSVRRLAGARIEDMSVAATAGNERALIVGVRVDRFVAIDASR